MSNVRLKKEDMNALIMNFLVTEVRLAHACASIMPVPGSLRRCCMLSTLAHAVHLEAPPASGHNTTGWLGIHLSAALLLDCSALC